MWAINSAPMAFVEPGFPEEQCAGNLEFLLATTGRIRVAAPAERRAPGPVTFAAADTQAAAPRVGVG